MLPSDADEGDITGSERVVLRGDVRAVQGNRWRQARRSLVFLVASCR